MKSKILGFLAVTLFVVVAFSAPTPTVAKDRFVTIGTGGLTGVYYPAGGAICRLVNRGRKSHGIRCSVRPTDGSIENIELLKSGEVEIAVVQSDWQYHASKGSNYFKDKAPVTNLRSLFSLHNEAFTVIARKDSKITKFDDLKGKKVNVGKQGSGMRATFDYIIKYKNWTYADFAGITDLDTSKQVKALCDGTVDAMIYSAGHPNGVILDATTTCDVKLVPVEGKEMDKLIAENPYYAYTIIPSGMYYGNDQDVKTVGVKATFVALDSLDEEVAYQITKAVFENFENFKTLHPVFANLEAQRLVHEANTAPLHPGAARYFKEKGML